MAALAYYAAFIGKASFRIDATRYFVLFDDAMVSMRYAKHLVHGQGLVWNVGERPVEGFSNPLWTLVMAGVHLLPLAPPVISLAVQILGAVTLAALAVAAHALCVRLAASSGRASDATAPRSWPLAAMILVAFYPPLVYWTLEGMEVGLLALCATAAAAMLLARRGLVAPYALLAAGVFVRMDFALVAVALAVAAARSDRERAARHVVAGVVAAGSALALQTIGRVFYFHDPLPNTYYLKLTGYPLGLRLGRGAWVLWQTILKSNGLLVLLPLAALVLARDRARTLLALMLPVLVLCAYSVWVGGDAWEGTIAANRYLCVGLPLLLAVAAWPVAALAERVAGGVGGRVGCAAAALLAVLAIAPYRSTILLDPPAYSRENADLAGLGLVTRGLTRDGASIAASAVGSIGYFSDRRIVDVLGKNDAHIARLPMRLPAGRDAMTAFVPGHLKWDYAYSIGSLRPDVVAQLWWNPREAAAYMKDYEPVEAMLGGRTFRFSALRGSPRVAWPDDAAGDRR